MILWRSLIFLISTLYRAVHSLPPSLKSQQPWMVSLVFVLVPALASSADSDWIIQGASPALEASLRDRFGEELKGSWNPSQQEAILHWLATEHGVDGAGIYLAGRQWILVVRESNRLTQISFTGLRVLSEAEARSALNLPETTNVDEIELREAAERLRIAYQDRGRFSAEVSIDTQALSTSETRARVFIREGPVTRLRGIDLRTTNPALEQSLKLHLRSYLGDELNQTLAADLRASIRGFFSRNRYYRAELKDLELALDPENSSARFAAEILVPEQYDLQFSGNGEFTNSSLLNALNLSEFQSANPQISSELAVRLREFYLANGYARIDITATESPGPRPMLTLVRFQIKEGPRVRIANWNISGRPSQDKEAVVNFIRQHSGKQLRRSWYVREELEAGIQNYLTDRRNNGYLKAKLVSMRSIYNSDRTEVTISLNLDDGPLTRIQKISFQGLAAFSESTLVETLGLRPGEDLRLNELEDGVNRLRSLYRDAGYLEMRLVNESDQLIGYNEDSTLAQLDFLLYEGPQIKVRSIQIEGNFLTKDYVILKELEFQVGDILTPKRVSESIRRLQRLNHFLSVEIRTLEEGTLASQRTVVVRVADRDPGLFNMGLGATNERGLTLRGFAGIAYRNIGGTGRAITARAEGSYNVNEIRYAERKLTLSYLEPYLFDTRVRGRLNYTGAITITNFSPVLLSELAQTTWTLEQDLTSNWLLAWDVLSIARYRDFSRDTIPDLPDRSQVIASTAVTTDLDFRDHPFNPSSGTFSRLNVEYGDPRFGSDPNINYIRALAATTHYWPLAPGWVWANSARSGYLRQLLEPDFGLVPYDKKGFFLGGQTTIRGFAPGEGFPGFPEVGTDRFDLRTTALMRLIKSELRIPIWGDVGTALFYDGGDIVIDGIENRYPWRHNVGIAIRYNTEFGPINLEMGWKLNAQGSRQEAPFAVHFSIGTF